MRKYLSLNNNITSSLISFNSVNNLTFKSVYFIRSSKRNGKNNKSDQNVQGNNNSNGNNQQNKQNDFKPQQPKNNVRITGPKKLMEMVKKGNVNIVPFYVNNMIKNTRNPSLPLIQQDQKPKQTKNQKVDSTKKQQTAQTASQIKNEVKDQIRSQQVKNQQKATLQTQKKQPQKPKKVYDYPFKSSNLYAYRLIKKYKIVQALKATRKLSNEMQIFSYLRDLNIQGFVKDPKNKVFLMRILFRTIVIFTFVLFYKIFIFTFVYYATTIFNKILPYPNQYLQKAAELNDIDVQTKLNQIKQIKIKTNQYHQNQLIVVLNQQKQLNLFESFFNIIGFNVNKNKQFVFDVQNPNIVLDGLEKLQQNKEHQSWIKIKPVAKQYGVSDAFWDTLFLATPFIGIALTYWIFTKINPDSMLKGLSTNKKSMKIQSTKDIKVRFKDVAGMQNAKKQITQFVDFLKKSDKYVQMGAKIPKGALLTGPPGTGKTMLAKACAGQAGTSFFYVSGSQFVQMFVGLGASRVRQLFAKARQQAPSIIFIDEIDAIGKKRQTSRNQQKDSTLNQMLVQMDGFSTSQTVIVLAATNRKDILDSALTRPGRFDRMVQITLPQLKARQEIFMVHLAPLKVNPNKPLSQIAKRLAQLTPGFSGADIANLCNEAAIIATRKKRQYIEDADFEQASQRIMAGYIKKGLSNEKVKKRVAYHQAGHAVCGWYLRGGDPLVKLTIIPRSKGALGYAQYLPKTAYIRTRSQLIDQIAIMLGGTTSEQTFLGNMSSGNSDDLQKVYGLARRMITQFGMGAKTYNFTLDQQTYVKKQSQKLCNVMDQQMLQVVNEATNRAKQIIAQKRQIVEQLAKELLQKQTLNNEDILRIMGQRPVFT